MPPCESGHQATCKRCSQLLEILEERLASSTTSLSHLSTEGAYVEKGLNTPPEPPEPQDALDEKNPSSSTPWDNTSQTDHEDVSPQDGGPRLTPTAALDFREFISSSEDARSRFESAAVFTISPCGGLFTITNGCTIHVFRFDVKKGDCLAGHSPSDGAVQLCTSVPCPGRVLAVSIDAAGTRLHVAVLLDGRRAAVFALQERGGRVQRGPKLEDAGDTGRWRSGPYPLDSGSANDGGQPATRDPLEGGFCLEEGSTSLFADLCSGEDPPRSIAVSACGRLVGTSALIGLLQQSETDMSFLLQLWDARPG